jgi:RND superfamily putative drug exporter
MSTRHSLPSDSEARPVIAGTIRWLSVPIILGWLAVAVVVNVVAPQLEEVGAAHSVAMTAKDAPSTIGMMRIGKDFQQFDMLAGNATSTAALKRSRRHCAPSTSPLPRH